MEEIMTEENQAIEEQEQNQEQVEQEEQKGEVKELPQMSCGYAVGVKHDGSFVFEILGDTPGLVQLLGLHKYADHRLTLAKEINQGYGFPVLAQQNAQLAEMLKVILNMMTEQQKAELQSQLIKP